MMMAYHRLLTDALQLCLQEGSMDQTKVNTIKAVFEESVVGVMDIPTAEDRFIKGIGHKFGPNSKNIVKDLNSARKRINDQHKQLQLQQQQQQGAAPMRMATSSMSSFQPPQPHPPSHNMQPLPQPPNMMQPMMQPQGVGMMPRPSMHHGGQHMPMMNPAMNPNSGYHPVPTGPVAPPMQTSYPKTMQQPPQSINPPMIAPQGSTAAPHRQRVDKSSMVNEILNRAVKSHQILPAEAKSYMEEWSKVEKLPVKEQNELIELALGPAYGPRTEVIMEAVARAKSNIIKEHNDRKTKSLKAAAAAAGAPDQQQQHMMNIDPSAPNQAMPPHMAMPGNIVHPLVPTPTPPVKTGKDTKKKQQEVVKVVEEKSFEEKPDDMLEKVDLNDGELTIEETTRKVYVSPCSNQTEQQEDDSAADIARSSGYLEQQLPQHSLPLASSSSSRSIKNNVFNAPLCRKVFSNNAYCKNITLTGDAQQVLSEGIQVHLKNILDSVLKLCQEKAQEEKAVYPVAKVVERVSEDMLEKVALKLGPKVENLLRDEESNARKFFDSFCREDDRKLEVKMQAEQVASEPAVGNKRKAVEMQSPQTWMQQDKLESDSGRMSWIELAEFQHKLDIMNQAAKSKVVPKRAPYSNGDAVLSVPAIITKEDFLNIVHNHKYQVPLAPMITAVVRPKPQ